MIDAIHIGESGLQAQQTSLNNVANNLANVNTPGFKKGRVAFSELLDRSVIADVDLNAGDAGIQPSGVAATNVDKIFTVGEFKKTENPMDVAIQGAGFMEVRLPNQQLAYTRSGSLRILDDGTLANANGDPLTADIQVPSDARRIEISGDGVVTARVGNDDETMELGQIELAMFNNPQALKALGDNVYVANENTGEVIYTIPGESGSGALAQGFIESSNVQLVNEMTDLVLTQRAYQLNARVVQVADELLGINNDLRR